MELKEVSSGEYYLPREAEEKKGRDEDVRMEDVLEQIGGFGKFQLIFTCLVVFPQLSAGMIVFSPVFTSSDNVPLFCSESNRMKLDSCGLNCTERTEDSVMSSVIQEWELVCSRRWIGDTIISCQMAGMMLGGLISSRIADRYGRKFGYWFVTLGMIVSGVFPAIAYDPYVYAFTRFLAGFGEGGILVVHISHLMEFLTPAWRVICAGIPLWFLGQALLGPVAYYLQSWRCLTIAIALPPLLVLPFYAYILESPRWLLTRKRTKEAYEILKKVAHMNSKPAPKETTIETLQDAIIREADSVQMLSLWETGKEIWRNKGLCKQFLILVWLNITASLVCYGVSFNSKGLSGNHYMNMVYMGLFSLGAVIAMILCNNQVGRKKTLFSCMLLGCLLELVPVINFELGDMVHIPTTLFIGSAILGRSVAGACQEIIGCIILETFPTTMRASCLGMAVLAAYMGSIVAPQTAYLNEISQSIPYGLYSALALSSAFLSLFIKETAGVPLKDSIDRLDGSENKAGD